jgi:hypothetical protein
VVVVRRVWVWVSEGVVPEDLGLGRRLLVDVCYQFGRMSSKVTYIARGEIWEGIKVHHLGPARASHKPALDD